MTEWKTYKLGDVIDKIIDNRGKSAPISTELYQPIIEINAIGDRTPNYELVRKWVSQHTYNTWFRSGHPIVGDILIPTVGTIGIASIMNENRGCIAQNIIALRTNDKVNNLFLYYFLRSDNIKQQLLNLNIGGVQPSIKVPHLLNLEIILPPLEEQRKIAGILGAIDDKIENNRRINANLEQQAQALYKQWFVDFEFPNKEGKPYKSSGGKMADSELGLIPEGWNAGKLENMGSIVGGGTPSKAIAEYYTENGIAWITPKDLSLTHSKFTSKGEIDITELGYNNSSTKIMPRGSVLFSSRAPIGYISIAKNEICTNQGFKSVIPNNGYTAFVYYYLLANTSNIEAQATGSTFKEASGALMKSLDIVIPNNSLIEEFEGLMSPIFDKQEGLEEENTTLTTLRDTLLPKLMNGEIKM